MRCGDDLLDAVGTEFLRKAADTKDLMAVMALHIWLLFGGVQFSHVKAR